ncbi:MAG: tRNA (adenosine(37)-N6)-threonylcarbamoyltransferase complex transferase subunit TsaD, partial [Bacteroidota bacterium]
GGPLIDQYAEKGDPNAFPFKKSKVKGLDFSFSGVKTSVLYFLQKQLQENPQFIEQNLADLCASLQHTIIQMLMEKLKKAAIANNIKSIGIAGGVSANKGLRQAVLNSSQMSNWNIFIPEFQYCTDNAGMIAKTGSILYDDGIFGKLTDSPLPRMPFEEG